MATYAEYLKSQGASDEEIKVLDIPVARKAWETSEATRLRAETDRSNMQKWYDEEAIPAYKTMEQKMIDATAEAAKQSAIVRAAQEQGLIAVAKAAGTPTEHIATPPAGFDPSKYVTQDTLLTVAEREGDAIAIAQDIAYEHSRLFPDKPLNFRELRREAVSRKIAVEQLWMEKFGVTAARQARSDKEKADYEARLIKQGEDAALAKFADQYGNPNTRPLSPSSSPFTLRPQSGRDKQPWEANPDAQTADRVRRATDNFVKSVAATGTRN